MPRTSIRITTLFALANVCNFSCSNVTIHSRSELPHIDRMAVLETSNIPYSDTLEGYLVVEITRADVETLERSLLERLLGEQDLQLVLSDPETVVKAGRLAGAQAILFHDTTEIRAEYLKHTGGGWWIVSGNFRLVDVERGTIVLAGSLSISRNVTPELVPLGVGLALVIDFNKLHNEMRGHMKARWQGPLRDYAQELGQHVAREILKAKSLHAQPASPEERDKE